MTNPNRDLTTINQLKRQLSPADRKYIDDLQVYLNTATVFYSNAPINAQLLAMLQDLLNANQDGLNAAEWFGHDPQSMADEILRQFPQPQWRAKLRDLAGFVALIIGISWFSLLLSSQKTPQGLQLNLLAFVGVPIVELIVIGVAFKLLHRTTYQNAHSFFHRHLPVILMGLIFLLGVAAILVTSLSPIGVTYILPTPWDTVLLTSIILVATSCFAVSLYWRYHS
ncbi:DUF1129 domain-containing protein [Levilactobacillus suantsaii]|uniref:DUF1129 family protein n=1 Tax=Levilactobacillus suantsaii TaxID=2292255 RepID=A0A4Q0VHQ0_9LACO|nr:hypothetical protein [Levilactobacillus suantsaii]QMU08296.1 hypothetical protein H3M12_01040 [Levilactobacillus suantsaii]RXI78764.1 hypothetical protein DXH47_05880 [Levilactobacillus suantsaii]